MCVCVPSVHSECVCQVYMCMCMPCVCAVLFVHAEFVYVCAACICELTVHVITLTTHSGAIFLMTVRKQIRLQDATFQTSLR